MSKEDRTNIPETEVARINNLLFTDRAATLPHEMRLALTEIYLNHFTFRQVDDLMIAQAEMTSEEVEGVKNHVKQILTEQFGRNPAAKALERRVNFVQMLNQQRGTASLFPRVKHTSQIRRANLDSMIRSNNGNWPSPDSEARIFNEPFYYDALLNMIKHYEPDTPAEIKRIQHLNRSLQSLPPERHPGYYTPDPEWVGVVLLNK